MPLYSTGTQSKAECKFDNGIEAISTPEERKCTCAEERESWSYMFIHHRKVDMVSRILEKKHFPVFVHKSVVCKRDDKSPQKNERQTIPGLLFVQGNAEEIQKFLKEAFTGLYLVKDCSRGEIATISDSVMQPFMQISRVSPTRIRFMPHAFDYYSKGNTLIRITSGALAGLEGYRIRISRDKCLVTTIGGMTIAIGGIHQENFENIDEYLHQRREHLKVNNTSSKNIFTPLQQEIDQCFFTPQNQLDVMAIAKSLNHWSLRMKRNITAKGFDEAAEIALFLLDEVGSRFQSAKGNAEIESVDDIMAICREAIQVLRSIVDSVDVSVDLKEIVEAELESLAIRYSFLPIE